MECWRLVNSETVVDTGWVRVYRNTYANNAGLVPDYYVLSRSGFVLIVAVDGDYLVLVRQYRPATERFYISVPGGYIDPGETPIMAAKRELLEETGAEGSDWSLLGELHPLPGYIRSTAHVFSCNIAPGRGLGSRDAGEETELVRVGRGRAVDMIRAGDINEMQAVAAILLAELKCGPR